VSGAGGPGATVVVVVDSVVVEVDDDDVDDVAAFSALSPHDDAATANRINRPTMARVDQLRM
jgi:hypothetical protein